MHHAKVIRCFHIVNYDGLSLSTSMARLRSEMTSPFNFLTSIGYWLPVEISRSSPTVQKLFELFDLHDFNLKAENLEFWGRVRQTKC